MIADFNIIATTARGKWTSHDQWNTLLTKRRTRRHQAQASKTKIRGLIVAKQTQNPYEIMEKLRTILTERPYEFRYALRILLSSELFPPI